MGRPPTHGAPSFRFHPSEVAHMENILREHGGHVPAKELLVALAEKFSNSPERAGKITVQNKQVWNWFQNRRYALRSKLVKPPGSSNFPPNSRDEIAPLRSVPPVPQQTPVPSGHNVVRNTSENPPMEFEAKSARDGAWYDVQAFLSHRYLETGNPEVLVRFAGFGPEEDEWVNVRKLVRQRSLPCESSECVAVLPGDLILCFQEGKEQALYFDAHVLDAQRRRHDLRGCRCRFLVRYDHDQSEEIVPLRKVCRRPETDYRLQQLHAANESASTSFSAESRKPVVDPTSSSMLRVTNVNTSAAGAVNAPIIMNIAAAALQPPAPPTPAAAPAPISASTLSPVPISARTPSGAPISPPVLSSTPIFAPNTSATLSFASAPPATVTSVPTPPAIVASSPTPPAIVTSAPTPPAIVVSTPIPSATLLSSPTKSVTAISAPATSATLISAPITYASAISTSTPSMTPLAPSITPISASTPVSTPVLASSPTPAPVSASTPAPTPVPFPMPCVAPELMKIESDNQGSSAGEASTQDVIINPGAESIVMEVKKEEISNSENSLLTGNSASQGETCGNPAVTVLEPEKVGISAPNEPAMAVSVSTATTDGGPIVSTMEENSNLVVSAVDTKE